MNFAVLAGWQTLDGIWVYRVSATELETAERPFPEFALPHHPNAVTLTGCGDNRQSMTVVDPDED